MGDVAGIPRRPWRCGLDGSDLLRFARMLLDGGAGLLSPASTATMITDQLTSDTTASWRAFRPREVC